MILAERGREQVGSVVGGVEPCDEFDQGLMPKAQRLICG
jgi:hypothetical protein